MTKFHPTHTSAGEALFLLAPYNLALAAREPAAPLPLPIRRDAPPLATPLIPISLQKYRKPGGVGNDSRQHIQEEWSVCYRNVNNRLKSDIQFSFFHRIMVESKQ